MRVPARFKGSEDRWFCWVPSTGIPTEPNLGTLEPLERLEPFTCTSHPQVFQSRINCNRSDDFSGSQLAGQIECRLQVQSARRAGENPLFFSSAPGDGAAFVLIDRARFVVDVLGQVRRPESRRRALDAMRAALAGGEQRRRGRLERDDAGAAARRLQGARHAGEHARRSHGAHEGVDAIDLLRRARGRCWRSRRARRRC